MIKENIRKTFLETQSKVNKWVSDLRKKIDGDDEEEDYDERPSQGYRPSTYQQEVGGRRSGDLGRRSGERERYDADPQVLGDDFAGLELRDDEGKHGPCSKMITLKLKFDDSTASPNDTASSEP